MWPKFMLFALICFLSIAITMPDSMIARLGLDTNYLFAALAAIVIAALSVHRSMLLVILFAILIALIVIPFLAGKIDFD